MKANRIPSLPDLTSMRFLLNHMEPFYKSPKKWVKNTTAGGMTFLFQIIIKKGHKCLGKCDVFVMVFHVKASSSSHIAFQKRLMDSPRDQMKGIITFSVKLQHS